MNLLIIGYRQHGKSDVGAMLAEQLDTVAHDSSWYACQNVIYPILKDRYGYASPQAAHDDRMNHRQEWFELIEAYNTEPDRLTKAILREGTVYVGMRSRMEFEGSKHHFDHVIWVDAAGRVPAEDAVSMKLTMTDADYVLNNNGLIECLPEAVSALVRWLALHITSQEPNITVCGIDPLHHRARGTLPSYIAEQILLANTNSPAASLHSVASIDELAGGNSDKPFTPMMLGRGLTAPISHVDELAWIPNVRTDGNGPTGQPHDAHDAGGLSGQDLVGQHSGELYTSTADSLSNPPIDYKLWIGNIKAAFESVKADVCRCQWNPDQHAIDCPVRILESAINDAPNQDPMQ